MIWEGNNPTFLIGIGKLGRTPQESREVPNPTFLIGICESHGTPEECPIQTQEHRIRIVGHHGNSGEIESNVLIGIGKLGRTPQENHEVPNPTFLIGI